MKVISCQISEDMTTKTLSEDDFGDINPNDIESVNVEKIDDEKLITILLKNGEKIVRKLKSNATEVKTFIIDTDYSKDEDVLFFHSHSESGESVAELFPEINEDDIEEVEVMIDDGKKTVKITTKDGEEYEKEVEASKMTTSNAVFVEKMSLKNSESMEKRLNEMEEGLKRMEKMLEKLLEKNN